MLGAGPLRTYAAIVAVAALFGLWIATGFFAYDYGKQTERSAVAKAVAADRKKVAQLSAQLEALRAKREAITAARVRVIERAPGEIWEQRISPPDALQALKDG